MKFVPHSYQIYAIEKILATPRVALWLDMGLGKTVTVLTALNILKYDWFEVDRALVIAPLRVAKYTWPEEVRKWDHLRHLRVSVVAGLSPDERRIALERDADIYVINRDLVPWLVEYLLSRWRRSWPWDVLVLDESSSFKNPSGKRFRALRKIATRMQRVIELTGTPASNTIQDLWSQIYLLDGGARLGKTVSAFRSRFMVPQILHYGPKTFQKWTARSDALQKIHSLLSDIVVSMRAEDWLTLPQKIVNPIKIHLSEEALKLYRKLERDYVLRYTESDVITAPSAGALGTKLLQLANGAVYDDQGKVYKVHDEKLEALKEIVEDASGPVLVYYAFRHDLQRLRDALPGARMLENERDIKDWNDGKIDVLLAHPASAGHGLNLQAGGSVMIWFGLPWSLELYQQAVARLYRQGQTRPVIIHHLIAAGTIDEDVAARLEQKAATQETLIEALKARIERVKGAEAVYAGG